MKNSDLFAHGEGVNTHRQSLHRTSDEFVTHNDLRDIAIALTFGVPVRAPRQTQLKYHRAADQQEKLYESLKLFLDEFLPECNQHLSDLRGGDIPSAHVSIVRADRWVFEPAFLKLLAGCFQIWTDSDPDTDALSSYIRDEINFDRSVALGIPYVQEIGLIDTSGRVPKPIRKTSQAWKGAAVKICHAARGFV